jgi:hypothetical protein
LELLELHEVAFVERSRGIEPTTMTQRFQYDVLHACVRMLDRLDKHTNSLCPMVSGFILHGFSYHLAADHQPAMSIMFSNKIAPNVVND